MSPMSSATSTASCCNGHQAGQGAAGLVVQRAAGLELGLLFEIADVERSDGPARAAVGLLLVGEDPHQRGLAGAVGPDQPDALAGAQLERHPVQDRLGAVVLSDIDDVQENHSRRVSEQFRVNLGPRPPRSIFAAGASGQCGPTG